MPEPSAEEKWEIKLPDLRTTSLRRTPCLLISHLLPFQIAQALRAELLDGLEYERVELGWLTRQWRAVRPLGDAYFGPMLRKPGWATPDHVAQALGLFESPQFVTWLSRLAGKQLTYMRPPTAYRLERSDRICLHDDMSDPSHAVAVAYNLSMRWRPEWGGETVFGEVESVVDLETPPDSPIDLRRWQVRDESRFLPQFNSLLVMKLGFEFAHGVDAVIGPEPRLAVVGIYGSAQT